MEYRDIPGYEGKYRVSDCGVVESRTYLTRFEWRPLKDRFDSSGYKHVVLYGEHGPTTFKLHRLVLESFVGPCPEGMQARHLDGNKTNNCLTNLRWGSRKENAFDKERHGTHPRGEAVWNCKLTDADVRRLRSLVKSGHSIRSIAKILGVSAETARQASCGNTWKHIQ